MNNFFNNFADVREKRDKVIIISVRISAQNPSEK